MEHDLQASLDLNLEPNPHDATFVLTELEVSVGCTVPKSIPRELPLSVLLEAGRQR